MKVKIAVGLALTVAAFGVGAEEAAKTSPPAEKPQAVAEPAAASCCAVERADVAVEADPRLDYLETVFGSAVKLHLAAKPAGEAAACAMAGETAAGEAVASNEGEEAAAACCLAETQADTD